jgi:hypothetical protein
MSKGVKKIFTLYINMPSVVKSTSKVVASLCTPAALYAGIACLSLIMLIYERYAVSAILFQAFFIVAWTWVLNFLCSKGYTGISWFLVLLPFIFMVIALVITADIIVAHRK